MAGIRDKYHVRGNKVTRTFMLQEGTANAMRKHCEELGCSMSAWLEITINEQIARDEKVLQREAGAEK